MLGRRTSLLLRGGVLRSGGKQRLWMQNHYQGMLGGSQQAGWCKESMSPTKARATLKVISKTIYTVALLTITAVTGAPGNKGVSVTMGDNTMLTCPLKPNITVVTWKISPKVGGQCTFGYRTDINQTISTSCSDSINWKFRPDVNPAIEIRQVGIDQEGNYTCEVVSTEGNFHKMYHLIVLVPPRPRLYCDAQGIPVCEAAAGMPAAHVSWVLGDNSHSKKEGHDNGTVTVLSRFTACSTNVTTTTCMVFHPAGNWSESIACCPSRKEMDAVVFPSTSKAEWKGRIIHKFIMHHDVDEEIGTFLHCVISLTSLLVLLFLLAVFHLYTFCSSRTMRN